jgi:hypothetical protein
MSTEFQALFSQFNDTDTYKAIFDGESLFVTTQKAVCKKEVHAGTSALEAKLSGSKRIGWSRQKPGENMYWKADGCSNWLRAVCVLSVF